ncbi:MAG: PfkB family carbohydrate kinase [Anaerolineae bacterium]|nr:PfkB family carbohydrate kinase [Anaerolineae bacterium]
MMQTTPCFDILFLGHFAVDRNVVDGVAEMASGGAVYYGGIAAARLGARVAVVTRLSRTDFGRLDELREAGIAVFATPAAATSGIENTYRSADMERRVCVPLAFAGPFAPTDMPDVEAHIYAAVPIMAGEIDLALLKQLAARTRATPACDGHAGYVCPPGVALDVQGFVRVQVGHELLFRPWAEMAEGLAHVTYLKVDRAEAEALTGESDLAPGSPSLARAAAKLAAYGPREIVLTQSAGVSVYADGQMHFAPFTPRSLAGRTGRGDTCFATYLARRLTSSPEEACRWAGIVTSLKQETPGPWRG